MCVFYLLEYFRTRGRFFGFTFLELPYRFYDHFDRRRVALREHQESGIIDKDQIPRPVRYPHLDAVGIARVNILRVIEQLKWNRNLPRVCDCLFTDRDRLGIDE